MQRKSSVVIRVLCVGIILCCVMIAGIYALSTGNKAKGASTEVDLQVSDVIPDKYNTGIEPGSELRFMSQVRTLTGIQIQDAEDKWKLDIQYGNSSLQNGDVVVIEGIDFSERNFVCQNEKMAGEIDIIFRNCKFASFSSGREENGVHYIFEHCQIERFYGSNASLVYCRLGGSIKDAINPFVNVEVLNCFISDMAHLVEGAAEHTDGMQIYGAEGVDAHNIRLENCRFEIPAIPIPGNNSYVNACIFIGLEYSNGYDITVRNCIMNGGGFCIYSNASAPYVLHDVILEDIKVGNSHRYGIGFDKIVQGTEYKDIEYLDSLYVASVWKQNGQIFFSVTNDTGRERVLKVCTEAGAETYIIPKAPSYEEMVVNCMTYEDMPFDLLYTAEGNSWIKCYDITDGVEKEIRYEEWK